MAMTQNATKTTDRRQQVLCFNPENATDYF
jgi:hypothetical protein